MSTTRRFADLSQCDLANPLHHRFFLPTSYERYGADVLGPIRRPPAPPSLPVTSIACEPRRLVSRERGNRLLQHEPCDCVS